MGVGLITRVLQEGIEKMSSLERLDRWAWCGLGVALLSMVFAWWMSLAPRPAPESAPSTAFSAARAMQHTRAMAHETHPAGSVANDRVCAYIQDQLKAMDVEMELIHEYVNPGGRSVLMRRAVLGRIRGTAPTKAFAIDAHFDSVPYGPGATDDISGVSAMLETARALKAGSPLMNDVIFVFADEEEFNMGGARAFTEHAWFRDVGVMLGLETRGTSGPALMFETSQNNGFVIREMAKSNAKSRATSIMFDVYDRLPFGSDFGRYKRLVAGLNVAYVDDFAHYHTKLDNPENASLASLQHHGSYTLDLARHFGNIPLEDCYAPNVTYFNTLGSHMVVYSQRWNGPLAALALAVFGAAIAFGIHRRRLSVLGMAVGLGVLPAAALLQALVVLPLSGLLFWRFREATLYWNNTYCVGFALFATAALFVVVRLAARWSRPQELLAGSLPWLTVLLLLLLKNAPGGVYAATWPLFFSSLALLGLCLFEEEDGQPSPISLCASALLVTPSLMLVAPSLVMFAYTLTAMAGFMLNIVLLLILSSLAPHIHVLSGRARWGVPGAMAGFAIVLYTAAFIANHPSPSCPRLNCLSYGMDFDTGQAYWLSADRELDEWTAQFFSGPDGRETMEEFIPGDSTEYLKAPAPAAPFPKPQLDIVSDRVEAGRRILDLRLDSPRDAQRTYLKVTSDVKVHRAKVLGHTLRGRRHWQLNFDILPREGVDLRLEAEPGAPLIINVREVSYGVPTFPSVQPRPDWMATEPNRTLDHRRRLRSEHTFSTCTLDLGTGAS